MGGAEVKEEGVESEFGAGNPAGNNPIPHNTGVGISTRRTTYVMVSKRKRVVSSVYVHLLVFDLFYLYILFQEVPSIEEKILLPNLPAPVAPPKPARPTKPRPKSRISRYRSSSSQRARRQRQALAQQAAAAAAAAMAAAPSSADQGASLDEEGPQGPYGAEHGHGERGLGGHLLDGDGQGLNCINRGNLRYPKTKKVRGH